MTEEKQIEYNEFLLEEFRSFYGSTGKYPLSIVTHYIDRKKTISH